MMGAPDVPLRETCRLVHGRVPLWPYHRARLRSGGCGEDVLAAADRAVHDANRSWKGPHSTRLRLTVVVGSDGAVDAAVQRRLSSLDVPGGPRAVPVEVERSALLPPGAAKPADRSWWDDAQRRARAADGDQALIVLDGRVVDGGTATVWISDGSRIVTPPAPGAIAGVGRAFLLETFSDAGIAVDVRDLSLEEFATAREAFLTNAFGGAVAVRGRDGAMTGLASAFFASMWSPHGI